MTLLMSLAVLLQSAAPHLKLEARRDVRNVVLSTHYLDVTYPNCSRWRPTVAQIEAILKASRPIRSEQFHELDYSPCQVEGERAAGGGNPMHFRIDAWGVVMLWPEGHGTEGEFRYCDKACRKYFPGVRSNPNWEGPPP